jgi:hypothetical protein
MALYPKKLPPEYRGVDLTAEGFMTVAAAAKHMSWCAATVYNLMNKGLLPYSESKGFKGRRIPRTVLRIYAERM